MKRYYLYYGFCDEDPFLSAKRSADEAEIAEDASEEGHESKVAKLSNQSLCCHAFCSSWADFPCSLHDYPLQKFTTW